MTRTITMRAAVLTGPRRVELRDVPRPEPKPGEVRVKLEGIGLCGSNLVPWQGREWARYPLEPGAPGHEGWGVIDALGSGVRGHEEGQRVTFASGHAFAEYDVVSASSLVPVPRELDGRPVPGEPLGCVMNVFRRSEIRDGQTVAIVGIGFLGALLAKLALDAGARVLAIARRPFALELAGRFGAHERIAMDDHRRIIERVRTLTNGRFCERVIEVTGEQWPLDLAGELTMEGGRMVIAGYHQDPRSVNMQLWNWRGFDVVNAHERDPNVVTEGIRRAMEALTRGRLDLQPLLTHTLPLERTGEAFALLETRPDGFLKAVVAP
jgi:threonine dehydrogenase-like Zn-dependent dehydrogenase